MSKEVAFELNVYTLNQVCVLLEEVLLEIAVQFPL